MNYKVTKIGLLNFWLYDEEEYDFSDGKLLLRGENGSGKSVTMQSFIPLILDGNKSPLRLDPFGSTDKHIEAYLLGGIDSEQKEEAIGYLYMELFQEEEKKYITIGMGLHARRGRPVNFWGFALQDGRRIGKDFRLYKNVHEKIPFSKNELKTALGSENPLVESAKEYKKMVNNLVFGFPSLDQYDEFINVLLQLRSPKLSKDYKPTKLMSILDGVLQPLTEDDLAPLSDAIEDMDKTKEKTEQLKNDIKNINYLKKSYANYNETILYKKAANYLDSMTGYQKMVDEEKKQEQKQTETTSYMEKLKKEIEENDIQFEILKKERENIDSKDIDKATNRITELSSTIKKLENSCEKAKEAKISQEQKRNTHDQEIKKLEDAQYRYEREQQEELKEIKELSKEIEFEEPLEQIKENFDFSYIYNRVKSYSEKLDQLKEKLKEKSEKEKVLGEEETKKEQIQTQYQKLLREYEKNEEALFLELQNIKDQILFIQSNNKYVKLSEDEKTQILNHFQDYDKNKYYEAKTLYENVVQKYIDECNVDLCKLNLKINQSNEKLKELNDILEELKNKKEDELDYEREIEETKNYFVQNHIPYIPFYKAIEFHKDITEETKDKLESILSVSGILGAFVIEPQYLEKIKGHKGMFLVPGTKKKNNLTKYFSVSNEAQIDKNIIKPILESISIDHSNQLWINENEYVNDVLYGFGSYEEKSKYIGILAREENMRKKIEAEEKVLKAEEEMHTQLLNLRTKKHEQLIGTELEKSKFPSSQELDKKIESRKKISYEMDHKKEILLGMEEKIKELNDILGSIFREITDLRKDVTLSINLENIKEAYHSSIKLLDDIRQLENISGKMKNIQELIDIKREAIEEITNRIDDLLYEMHEKELEIAKYKKEKQTLEALLNTEEYKDITKRILELNEQLEVIPKEQNNRRTEFGRKENEIITIQNDLEKMKIELSKMEKIMGIHKKFFEEEYQLGYVMREDGETENIAKIVVQNLIARKNADMVNITNNYYNAYNEYHLKLSDYKLTSITLFDDTEEEFKELYASAKRNDFRVVYEGKKISLFALEKEIEDTILENEQIMSEQDRKIFGEVLLQTVGRKIRERIEQSKSWVKSINQIMSDMQQNSALSFSLEWKGKEKETLEEVDTRELVRLFQISSSMINEDDKAKLRNHFMSKLKNRVEVLSEIHDSYANIIFEILDYRTWFSFKMYYTRNGESKKELTDKVFSVFSGGEKAKTMYLPLFTAIVAKLQSARPNALRLVALDEAFAGVDDANIREMFGIMSLLNLDYILTSQALWGDYDTIKELSICELLRPNNSSVVGVRRYHWNGNVKEYVTRKEESDEGLGIF